VSRGFVVAETGHRRVGMVRLG